MEYPRLPDLNGWAALKALVQMGGVSAAAKALNVGQSAITKRLRALQSCYAMPLTERVDGRLRLTSAGERVYALAVQTLDHQLLLQQEIAGEAKGQSSMRLMATHDIMEFFLPGLMVRFHENWPDYQVETRVAYVAQICEHLISGSINLALVESAPDHPDVLVQRWDDDEMYLVCGRAHPLSRTDTIDVETLRDLKFVLRERGTASRNTVEDTLRGLGVTAFHVEMEVGPTHAVMDILAQGQYVSILPGFAVQRKLASGELHRLRVPKLNAKRSLWIARNRAYLKHPVTEAFISVLRDKQAA